MSYETRYAARRQAEFDRLADSPEAAMERSRRRSANRLGAADRRERFPIITEENAQAAIDFQEERIKYHYATLTLTGDAK